MIELRSAASLELGRLATLFTAAYEGYAIPFSIDEPTLAFMVQAYDLDAEASQVALIDGVPVALANLGVRGERGWIGGIGVTPFARRQGIAERLMRAVLDEARVRGVREVWLEVLVQNVAAIRLYEKLGFQDVRGIDVWILDQGAAGDEVAATSIDEAHDVIRARRLAREPWQRDDETLARLREVEPAPEAFVSGDGAVIVRRTPQSVSVIQVAGDAASTNALIASQRTTGSLNILNLPADEPAAEALRALGARTVVQQRELVLSL
jgi:ribosomal protein S18 acetylase RimI-like enzyme